MEPDLNLWQASHIWPYGLAKQRPNQFILSICVHTSSISSIDADADSCYQVIPALQSKMHLSLWMLTKYEDGKQLARPSLM